MGRAAGLGVGPKVVAVVGLKLVVVCPGGAVTGGPHAMHQLVSVANEIEPGSAAILYQPHATTPEPYRHYNCPVIEMNRVPSDALIVLPEIWPELSQWFPRNRAALWWLSVDNFGSHGQTDLSGIGLHLCQSEYAWRHVRWKMTGKCMMLTDWVEVAESEQVRGDRVVVNPAKDAGLMRPFMASNPDVEFVELRGLDRLGVAGALRSSGFYIDFGRHPGRDRPPREAALAGCVVLSVLNGSARLSEDMPIGDEFKFDSLSDANRKFESVREDWADASDWQAPYRRQIARQRYIFTSEVHALLESLG